MLQGSLWVPHPTWSASLIPILELPGHLVETFGILGAQVETSWTKWVLNPHHIQGFVIIIAKFLPPLANHPLRLFCCFKQFILIIEKPSWQKLIMVTLRGVPTQVSVFLPPQDWSIGKRQKEKWPHFTGGCCSDWKSGCRSIRKALRKRQSSSPCPQQSISQIHGSTQLLPGRECKMKANPQGKQFLLGDIQLWVWVTNRGTLQLYREGPL